MASASASTSGSTAPRSSFNRFWNDPSARHARERVLSNLDTTTLLSLRLATPQCAHSTAPHVFKDLTITFKSTTFTKPARLAALGRIGQHVRRLTFKMPHGDETFLPPLLEPTTGSEVEYVYTPNCSPVKSKPSRTQLNGFGVVQPCELNEGAKELSDLLVKQYPPLYHAAVNVPSFVRAFAALANLRYLTVSCPADEGKKTLSSSAAASTFGFGAAPTAAKSIVEHALVSLRIAIERNTLPKLDHLTLSPVQAHAIQYLNPVLGLGARPNSIRRWRQIKHLHIQMPVTTSAAHLKILHAYIGVFAPSLKTFNFHWLPGPARPASAGTGVAKQRESKMPVRPSSTGTSYFPRVITPQASNLSQGGDGGMQRGANPLTLHMSSFLQQDDSKARSSSKSSTRKVNFQVPKEKSSSASLDSLQSMTSASTLDSDSSSSPDSSPTRRPRLRCQPPGLHHQPSSTSSTSSTSSSSPTSLRPHHFPHLTFFSLSSILTTSHEISTFISTHGTHLSEFKFEATTLTSGDWDAALAPLTALAGGCDAWKREARREEEVPICLGPELSPVESLGNVGVGCGIGDLAVEGGLDLGGGGEKKMDGSAAGGAGAMGWGAKSPLLSMAMGMGVGKGLERKRMEVLPGGCAAEAAMAMGGRPWDRKPRKGNKFMGMGSGQKALEDGVRKLLAQTVFPWF